MSGNSIGRSFVVTTAGESHGEALVAIIDGCPPGLALDEGALQADVDRRRSGGTRHVSQRREADALRILSGVYQGRTTGAPIALLITNSDARPTDYADLADRFRPGHADYTWQQRYGHRDPRGGGRASARETVMRVAAGAIARRFLAEQGVAVQGWLAQVGPLAFDVADLAHATPDHLFCPDPARFAALEDLLDATRKAGDSLGARVCVRATGLPPGLGEPVFDRLDADLAHALMGINAVKGVEVGAGFRAVTQKGTEHRDEMTPAGFLKNDAGGVLGGISTGQDLEVALAFKPTSSLRLPARSVDVHGAAIEVVTHGRHDPCVGIRGVPIVEAMVLIVLMDHWLRWRAQCADVVSPTPVIPPRA